MLERSSPSPITDTGAIPRLTRFVLAHRRVVALLWGCCCWPGSMAQATSPSGSRSISRCPASRATGRRRRSRTCTATGETRPQCLCSSRSPTVRRWPVSGPGSRAHSPARAPPFPTRIVDYSSTRDPRFITRGGRATFALLFTPIERSFGAPKTPPRVARALAAALPPGTQVGLTGLQQLASGGKSKGPGVLVETLIGAAGALAVLAFVFAPMLAFVPLLIAATSILTTLLVPTSRSSCCSWSPWWASVSRSTIRC
jgi:putative drug exporter of the RND superfamily